MGGIFVVPFFLFLLFCHSIPLHTIHLDGYSIAKHDEGKSATRNATSRIFHFYGTKLIRKGSYARITDTNEEVAGVNGPYYFLNIHVEPNRRTIGQVNVTKLAIFTDPLGKSEKKLFDWCQAKFFIDEKMRVRNHQCGTTENGQEWTFLLTNVMAENSRIISGAAAYEEEAIIGHTILLSHFKRLLGCAVMLPAAGLDYWRATFLLRHQKRHHGIVGSVTIVNIRTGPKQHHSHQHDDDEKGRGGGGGEMRTRAMIALRNATKRGTNGQLAGPIHLFLSENCGAVGKGGSGIIGGGGGKNACLATKVAAIEEEGERSIADFGGQFLFQPRLHKCLCLQSQMELLAAQCVPMEKLIV